MNDAGGAVDRVLAAYTTWDWALIMQVERDHRAGVISDEQLSAGVSLAASLGEVAAPFRSARVRALEYLAGVGRPGETIDAILARLTDEQLLEFAAIAQVVDEEQS